MWMVDNALLSRRLGALAALLLFPGILLCPATFGGASYVPFDLHAFPPYSVSLPPEETAALRARGNYDVTEKTLLIGPEYELAGQELAAGRLPHWNPYVRAGAPLFANTWDGFAYPPHWSFFLFGSERSYAWLAWFSFTVAGVLMCGFMRALGLSWLPAVLGGVVFQLSTIMAANAHFVPRMESLVWLPGVFWGIVALSESAGYRRIVACLGVASCLSMAWLCGFPPFAVPGSMLAGCFLLLRAGLSWRAAGGRSARAVLVWGGLAMVLGVSLAAVQIVPMVDYFPHSQRQLDPNPRLLATGGFDPAGFAGLLAPAPFGDPASAHQVPYDRNPLVYLTTTRHDLDTGRLYPPNYNATEYAIYVGALPLLLAIVGLCGGDRLRAYRVFAATAIVATLALATGGWLLQVVSVFPPVRASAALRLACVVPFLLASLAAIGLDQGWSHPSRITRRLTMSTAGGLCLAAFVLSLGAASFSTKGDTTANVVTAVAERWAAHYPDEDVRTVAESLVGPYVTPALAHLADQARHAGVAFGVALVWLLLFFRYSPRRGAPGLALVALFIVGVDLLVAAEPFNPSFERRDLPRTRVDEFLTEQRASANATGGFSVARAARATTLPTALPPNLLFAERIRDLNAYAFSDSRSHAPILALYGQEQLRGRTFLVLGFPDDARLRHGLLDLYGVRYVLATEALESLGEPAIPPLVGPGGRFLVYERSTALPRAFLVGRAAEADDDAALEAMALPGFRPRAIAFLHERGDTDAALSSLPDVVGPVDPVELAAAEVRFVRDWPTDIEIEVIDSPGAWLVLTDAAMPHWEARLNGEPVPWWRADVAFRAVWVPEGTHDVGFVYDALPFRIGLGFTLVALSGMGALVVCACVLWVRESGRYRVVGG